MSIGTRDILGRGPSFPYNMSENGGLLYIEDVDKVNQSLFLIFETQKGSRLMMPEFGSDLHKYRFDPLDSILLEKIRQTIREDIRRWEPRISSVDIEFLSSNSDIDNSILYISINYRIINTNVTANYIYPYKMSTYDTLDINYN